MLKRTMTTAALALATACSLATPAFAQNPPQSSGTQTGFVQTQSGNVWRTSKLIGASVYGPDNASIGEVSDVLIAPDGTIRAVLVSISGFLDVAQKDVALPFQALTIKPTPDLSSIDKISVRYSKDDLKNAPAFAFDGASPATTGLGGGPAAPATPTAPTKPPQ
jgi:sporulation protein YlmC with PRC-barrel domain